MGIILSILSMAIYITETGLQLNDALTQSSFLHCIIVLILILGPLIISNIVSAILVLRNMDFSGKICGKVVCTLLHICQIGIIWRCLKLFMLYDEKDWREFLTLRVLHTALQSLPYVISKGVFMLSDHDNSAKSFATIIMTVVSSSLVLAMFNLRSVLLESDEFLDYKARRRKPFGIVFVIFGTLLVLLSRCTSILLMMSILPIYVTIPLGSHFLLYFLSSSLYMKCKENTNVRKIVENISFSYLAIFDVVISEFHKIECRYVFYYSVILIENIVMTALWMIISDENYVFKLSLVVMILASFIFGIILKCCSCGYVQPEEECDDPISEDTLDFAHYITKAAAAEQHLKQNGFRSSNKSNTNRNSRHKTSSTLPGRQAGQTEIETIYSQEFIENTSKSPKQRNKTKASSKSGSSTREDIVNAKLSKYRYTQNMRDTANVQPLKGESNGDLTSNNSRNTNTLNQSGKSHKLETSEEKELKSFNDRALTSRNEVEIELSSPRRARPALGMRSSNQKIDVNNICKSPQSKRNSTKKKDIPLFPNECNDLIGSKTFGSPKAKHVLSNSVSEYQMDDTYSETSYSEYLSYSYYVDSTDCSSISCDSDCALTWPPSNRIELVNLHSLPKEKISTTDSVRVWLSKLDDWEPSYDNQGFEILEELFVNSKSVENLPDAPDTDLVRRSSSARGQRPNIVKGGRYKNKSPTSDEMEYLAGIPHVSTLPVSNVPHIITTSNTSRGFDDDESPIAPFKDRSPRGNPLIVWHSDGDKDAHNDVVQESVV